MFRRIFRYAAVLLAVLFVGIGLRWLIDPAGAAESVGMPLLQGAALSTQIGDLASFFLTAGTLVLVGLITRNQSLVIAAALMIGSAAIWRTLAWLVHDAALTPQLILVELVTLGVLLGAARGIAAGR